MLFRRREVWVPTLWGWLALLAGGAAVTLVLALSAYRLLAPIAPARGPGGSGARILVVEGWLDEVELNRAIERFRAGGYERLLTTGGPIESWDGSAAPWRSYAERAAGYLVLHGVPPAQVTAVPAPLSAQERTFLSAVVLREWAARSSVRLEAIDLFSAGPHARRSHVLFRMALEPATEVGVIAGLPSEYDPNRWWRTSVGARTVIGEAIAYLWIECCFWPPAAGSHEERWGVRAPAP